MSSKYKVITGDKYWFFKKRKCYNDSILKCMLWSATIMYARDFPSLFFLSFLIFPLKSLNQTLLDLMGMNVVKCNVVLLSIAYESKEPRYVLSLSFSISFFLHHEGFHYIFTSITINYLHIFLFQRYPNNNLSSHNLENL